MSHAGRLPLRLVVGGAGVLAMIVACLAGPLVLPAPPPPDPVHAALLPPGSLVAVVAGPSRRTVVAPVDETTGADAPRRRFWLGSDRFGRDLLSLLLRGGRVSLLVAALSVAVALLAGTGVGLAAATGGRLVDALLMRLVDATLAFPVLFLMILVAALLEPGPMLLVAVLGLTSWMGLARIVRGQVLSLRARPFILAARAAGSRWHQIWGRHYLPNLVGPLAQDTALRLGDLVIAEATLSYLGLGIPPALTSWGYLVAEGHKVMLDGWWLATFPGIAIALLVTALALVGDGLQQLVEEAV